MKLYPEVFNQYVAEAGTLRTPASRKSFQWVIQQLQAAYPNQPINRFTLEQLTKFCIGEGLAPKTISHRRSVLRAVFEWAAFKGYVKENPAAGLKFTVSPGRHQVREGRWLEAEEVGEILRACPDTIQGRRDRLVLLFGFLMGLRLLEIGQLRWADLSADYRTLKVKGKGQKKVLMGVPPQLATELKAWRQEAPADAVAILPVMKEFGFPRDQFLSWDRGLGRTGIQKAVKAAGLRCGMELSPHDMRRSFAGILETKGVPVTDIQRAMRHSNVGTTSVYLDKNPRRAIATMEGLTIEY